jgi:hypothetical protein
MIEVVHDIVLETLIERRRRRLRNVPDSDGVAVGRSLGDASHADRTARAPNVLDHHGLAECPAHRFSNETRDRIGRASGCRRDHQRN